jgi:hypothetical protein
MKLTRTSQVCPNLSRISQLTAQLQPSHIRLDFCLKLHAVAEAKGSLQLVNHYETGQMPAKLQFSEFPS